MAKQPLNGVLQHIRKVAAVHTYRELSDCDLLERFVGARDEAAFTILIERHGPMVLGVCRRALPNFHDADDACQATFLVLARKASSVRKKTSLSAWLHGVACRVAANLKRDHARRKTREHGVDAPAPKDPAAEVSWREVQAILDDELQRLPERYRAPLILCYLECMTRDEAAMQLGLSPTTLYGRLERARDLMRACLTKRGLTLGAAVSAAIFGEGVVQAALAPTFVVSSTKAAMLVAAGQPLAEGVVATHVLAVTQEVIKTMFLTKLKLSTAAVLCAGLFVALIGGSLTSVGNAQNDLPVSGKAGVNTNAQGKGAGEKNRPAEKPLDEKAVLKELQGIWKLAGYEAYGKKRTAKEVSEIEDGVSFSKEAEALTWVIVDDQLFFQGKGGSSHYRLKLAPATTPGSLDLTMLSMSTHTNGVDLKGTTREGIFEIKGNTLRICLNVHDPAVKQRPQQFETKNDGPGAFMYVLKREKTK